MRMLKSLLILLSLMAGSTFAADTDDPIAIARALHAAHVTARPFPDVVRAHRALDEPALYEIQRQFVSLKLAHGSAIGGYKGGFIPRAPIGGVLWRGGMIKDQSVVERARFQSLLVEAEIAFRLCATHTRPIADLAALREATCAVMPAVELPDAAFEDLAALRQDFPHLRRLLIPTNVGASHVLLGEERDPATLDLDRIDVSVRHNDSEIGARPGATSDDKIWERVLWTINEFVIANGYTVSPDHVIIPGALTGLHPGEPGRYVIDYAALGKVAFEIR